MDDAMWREDIEQLRDELPRLHRDFFYSGGAGEFFGRIDNLVRDLPEMGTYDIVLEMARIVATARDAHTTLVLPQNYRLPFDCYPFDDGLYITAADKDHADWLHAKVVGIGDSSIEDIYREVADITPHENMQFVLSCLPRLVTCVDILYGLGVVEHVDSVTLATADADGKVTLSEIKPVKYADYRPAKRETAGLPLYRQHENLFYWSRLSDGVFYINYNRCRDMEAPAPTVDEFCRQLIDRLTENPEVEKVVIDLRNNTGGNSELFKPFLQWLSANESLNRKGKLFAVVGRDTFSSASLNVFYLKYNTEAIFVGEATGGKPNHFGEVKYLELKHSGLYIRYSTKYYELIEDDEQLSFVPDIVCPVSFADYAAGLDRCLEAVKEY